MLGDVLLHAAGTLRRSYEEVDWAATPLGPVPEWSPALRNAVELALQTRFPMTLFWGPEFTLVYNDAYVPLIADKHPWALGAPAREVFPEAWDAIGPMMESVLAGEGATWVEDASVPLQRRGRLEEAYFTFSYSPVRGDDGAVEGVMDIATETTRQVVDRRRLQLLGTLNEALGGLKHAHEVPARALPALLTDLADLPAFDVRIPGATGGAGGPPLPDAPGAPLGDRDLLVEERGDGRVAWLALAAPEPGEEQPLLAVALSERLAPDDVYLGFLRLVAASLAQALDRVSADEAERDVAAAERGLSEALQRSLLTRPLQPAFLQIAVRYQPAAQQAQIGGDWYDAFTLPDGSLTLVIGDVTGHDQLAAAAMAQVRNLLRGVSYTLQKPPAAVLAGLDEAMDGLSVGAYATVLLAQVEPSEDGAANGVRTLRWSNAGHPPPVLVAPDGGARLLEAGPDALLGVVAGGRADHVVALEPGASLVLYTDGLVERRGVPLSASLEWLRGELEGRQGMTAEDLCDHLIGQLGDPVEDDVALLVLQA